MTKAGTPRLRGITLGIAAVLGASLFMAPQAVADRQSDATAAIEQLQADLGRPGGADRGYTGAGPGAKEGGVTAIEGTDGYRQSFTGGTIYWTESEGAHILYGAVDAKYSEEGGPNGAAAIGFPITSEENSTIAARQAAFAGVGEPKIYWTPQNGAWLVRGPFSLAAGQLGPTLGAPVGGVSVDQVAGTVSQQFANGTLNWSIADGRFVGLDALPAGFSALSGLTLPAGWANLGLPGVQLPGLALPSVAVPDSAAVDANGADVGSSDAGSSDAGSSDWNKHWLWLLLLIPLLLLLWWLFGRRNKKTVVHAPRPAVGPDTPRIDVKAPAVKGTATAATAAAKTTGDGVGSYVKGGASVPVPVGAHLPLADVHQAPGGYPIKGDADSGEYHTPDSPGYQQTTAEIWFATEAAAKAAGFEKPKSD